jgi:hypothetical protein
MSMSYAMRSIVSMISLFLIAAVPACAAGVSPTRQTCIRDAMASGTAAIGNSAQLNTLYERYFVEEDIARVAAGKDWMQYDAARKNAQRNRVRRFVVEKLAPSLSEYGATNVKLVSENGSKVRGIITQPNGNKRTVTFDFAGPCQFVNITITGFGSLISFIGKEQPRPGN